MFAWIQDNPIIVSVVVGASIVSFVATLILVPAIIVRIPADYFMHEHRPPSAWADHHPVIRLTIMILKNTLGGLFMLAGLAMLVLPGQGLLTILVGFLIVDYPGKYRLEKWVVARPRVLKTINWMRRKGGREPLRTSAGSP